MEPTAPADQTQNSTLMAPADSQPASPIASDSHPVEEEKVEHQDHSEGKSEDYSKKLSEELEKLNKIYENEFASLIPAEGGVNAFFLKEPPIETPEFLKENKEGQEAAIERSGIAGFIPGEGLIIVSGPAASKLYHFMHADDKKRYGDMLETSVGNISYDYSKPEINSIKDLLGDTEPSKLTDVTPWNQATKTTAEIAEMKRFVQREEKVQEAIKAAFETTSHLAKTAG